MKNAIIGCAIIFVIGAMTQKTATAQESVTFLSNLGQTTTGGNLVGSDAWLAAGFQTGDNPTGYVLNSIQLDMMDASGTPSSFTAMLYATSLGGLSPGSSLGTLAGSADPAAAGTYSYNPVSTLTLLPGAVYFVVLTASTTVANGAYNWGYAGANNYNPSGGWFSLGGGWTSINGSTWNGDTAVFSQFAIDATAAPEPRVLGLFALGGLLIGFRRCKARSAQ